MISADRLLRLAGGFPHVSVLVDVGAFHGDFSAAAAAKYPDVRFIAVEPVPRLAEQLRSRANGLENYVIVNAAAGPDPGLSKLHVPTVDRFNFSSLLPMSGARTSNLDVSLDAEIDVRVERLDTLLADLAPTGGVVVKIDAQGADLGVLASLGAELGRVGAGVIETAVGPKTLLYEGSPTRGETVSSLRGSGFEVVSVSPEVTSNESQNLVFVDRRLLGRSWPLWRSAYPLLLLAAYGRSLAVRARICLALRTRVRQRFPGRTSATIRIWRR